MVVFTFHILLPNDRLPGFDYLFNRRCKLLIDDMVRVIVCVIANGLVGGVRYGPLERCEVHIVHLIVKQIEVIQQAQ